jgi:outer membrane protein OmpA-like peptidoglycan-associated protein
MNEGLGNPDVRFFAGATLSPSVNPGELDKDRDGVPNKYDQCPYEMEDLDGFQDDDGCPDPDNDGDGILDVDDACATEAEDIDGFQDEDGCPDPDNDGDGILDVNDACATEAETVNGYMDTDGCPDTVPAADSDGDGLDDSLDECPSAKEDFDGFQDEDGCPDRDNDLDGVLDAVDTCPNEKEVFNGFEDEDGCPDEAEARVYIDRSQIVITDKIYFETSKSVIKSESYSLLNEIADLLLTHTELKTIRVEGHTDGDGGETYNFDLSQSRAESVVDYLVQRGVDRTRLDPAGFGKRRPIADNDTEEGKRKNRRVEFLIIDKD